MSVAKVSEIIAISDKSYDDAIAKGIQRATKTLKNVKSAWITDHTVSVAEDGSITEHKVRMKLTFVLNE